LFIEEDHFLAEDFLHTLNIMQSTVRMTCSQCNILSLGTYLKTYNYYADSKKVSWTQDYVFPPFRRFKSVLKHVVHAGQIMALKQKLCFSFQRAAFTWRQEFG
jgi:N-acetylglucosaminyltransferase II (MGAT2).